MIGTTVTNLNLTIKVKPVLFPSNRRHHAADAIEFIAQPFASASLNVSSHAWGGESIAVDRLEVGRGLEGEPFIIRVLSNSQFEISHEDFGISERGLSASAGNRAVSNIYLKSERE